MKSLQLRVPSPGLTNQPWLWRRTVCWARSPSACNASLSSSPWGRAGGAARRCASACPAATRQRWTLARTCGDQCRVVAKGRNRVLTCSSPAGRICRGLVLCWPACQHPWAAEFSCTRSDTANTLSTNIYRGTGHGVIFLVFKQKTFNPIVTSPIKTEPFSLGDISHKILSRKGMNI